MNKVRGFEIVSDNNRKHPDKKIILPTRGSKNSAGYDFYATEDMFILPHNKCTTWSDVKAYMQSNEVLQLYVRSSIGIKKGILLANGTGIIDSDYYQNPDNDGNIAFCLYNTNDKPVLIEKGERIAQGIFINYLQADNGNTEIERIGGIGSTGKE